MKKYDIDEINRAIAALRESGSAVVIFSPDELGAADPGQVCNLMVERGWDAIECLNAARGEAE